jgi:hypothetical protein
MAITFPSTEEINSRLDELEAQLPALPARIFKFQRAVANAYCERTTAAFTAIGDAVKSFLETARNSGATVTGQARAAAEDVATSVRTGVATVSGQATAQGRKVSEAAETQASKLIDQAIDAVEDDVDEAIDAVDGDTPGSGTPYEEWTKAELVERAKELDIAGPTRMSKAELIDELRAAS